VDAPHGVASAIKIDLTIPRPVGKEQTYPLVLVYNRRPTVLTVPDFYLRFARRRPPSPSSAG